MVINTLTHHLLIILLILLLSMLLRLLYLLHLYGKNPINWHATMISFQFSVQ